ncbi:hypothetical protein L873DRAFT_1575233, partial [Choiromyces venosus 120613-1]
SHTIAATVSSKFLDFSAYRGNDLRPVGVKHGCRWCLCVSRWKEVYDAYKAGNVCADAVPGVGLNATHKKALEKVSYEQLEEFA